MAALRILMLVTAAIGLTAHADQLNPLFERRLPTEAEDIVNIGRGIQFLQQQQVRASGKALRGTHAKGVCVRGELTVGDDWDAVTAAKLKRGMFSVPGRYPVTVRFANAEGKVQADQIPDVRAVSLTVSGLPPELSNAGGRMDFAMNNSPTFPINDAHVFADLMIMAKDGLVQGGWEIGVSGLWAVKNAISLGDTQKSPPTVAYQQMSYWSDVPFQLGPDQAVKYALIPCRHNPAQQLTDESDTLSLELMRHIGSDATMSCFALYVQILNSQSMRRTEAIDWIENATWEWTPMQATSYPVAELNLIKNSLVDQKECEALKIDVSNNSSAIHRGLGSINRARATGESASAKNR